MNGPVFYAPQGRQYLAWVSLAFLLGVAFALAFPIRHTSFPHLLGYTILFLLTLAFLLILVRFKSRISFSTPDMILLWFFLCFFFLGIFRVFSFEQLTAQALQNSAGVSHEYIGVLLDNPSLSSTGKSYGFPVRVLYLETDTGRQSMDGNILLYAPTELAHSLSRGDTVSFTATLTTPTGAPFSGGFSTRDYLYRQGYRFQEYTDTLVRLTLPYEFGFFDRIRFLGENIQSSMIYTIDKSFGEQSPESALLKGILLGVQEDFTLEQYQDFIDSGLLHITSVSGMHVVFLSGFFLSLFEHLYLPNFLSNLLFLPILFLFCSVASFTPSVCRSSIMMSYFILAQFLQREADHLTSLGIATTILLLINPYNLTSYSFLLSFSSTLGILLFSSSFQYYLLRPFYRNTEEKKASVRKPPFHRFFLDPVSSSLSMTTACQVGMGFLGMRFFRRISLGSFPANLCLIPFSSISFLLGLINWPLFYLCPPLAKLIAQGPLKLFLWCINQIASWFSHPIFQITTPTPPLSGALPYLGFCAALYFLIRPISKNNA